jgi:Gpi18-like mannosyltransferase
VRVLKQINYFDLLIVVVGVGLAVALRYSMLDFKSVDFLKYTKVWYNTLKEGGFSAFKQSFSNYNVPYLYLLYLVIRFFPNLPPVVATKIPSLIADFIMAGLVFRIVRLKYTDSPFPMVAAFVLLFAPTIALNSAFWGQADALYTTALVACIYFLLTRQEVLAIIMFGVSVAFKAQGVFLSPLLFALVLRRELRWRYLLLVPAVMLAALIPAWLAGRSFIDLLSIYPAQAGQYEQLSMHAPSIFSWIPDSGSVYGYFYPAGIIGATAVALAFAILIYKSKVKMTPSLLIELSVISVMLMPFLLPKMHERYFYPADVLTILLAFYCPRLFLIPISMSIISFFTYQPTIFETEPISIAILAVGVLLLLIVLIRNAVLELYPPTSEFPEAVK